MKTLSVACLAIVASFSAVRPATGSAEGSVPSLLTAATISADPYRFAVELDNKLGLKSVVVTFGKKTIAVPAAELPKIEGADLRQSYISTFSTAVPVPGPHDEVILIIPFAQEFRARKGAEGDGKAGGVRVSNVLRLKFSKGEFLRWEMAVSLGEKSNAWQLSYKDAKQPVQDNGKEDGLANPYWGRNAIEYSTE